MRYNTGRMPNKTAMRNTCPVCQSKSIQVFLEQKNVPVHQNYLFTDQKAARNEARGNLSIAHCLSCGFVFNASFDADSMTYDQNYENTQNYSPMFEGYIDEQINYLVEQKGMRDAKVIEIGCGKGDFLKRLVEKGNNSGIGFDPSYLGPLNLFSGKLRFMREFYNEKHMDEKADLIICRHVIEHIPDPVAMLVSIRKALEPSKTVQVIFETPDVKWILRNGVIFDFFFEHCSYFSRQSIQQAFETAGFSIDSIKTIFGDQYLWVESKPSSMQQNSATFSAGHSHMKALVEEYSQSYEMWVKKWRDALKQAKEDGPIALWGAGAKGVTFANLFDPDQKIIDCVVDINPNKQGKFLPGTGHPIISPSELLDYRVRTLIPLNPNYIEEINDQIDKLGMKEYQVLDLTSRSMK